jgi:hypothetical protein
MRDKVIVIRKDGTEVTLAQWQEIYGLTVDSDKIGRHFSLSEHRFTKDIELFGTLVVNEQLMKVLDGFREVVKVPITINSFNRDQAKQDSLKDEGFKTAKYSPHVAKLAADIDTTSEEQTREWVKILQQVASILGITVRIGFEQYLKAGQTFIHVDVCPEYYATGKPWANKFHPIQWAQKTTW